MTASQLAADHLWIVHNLARSFVPNKNAGDFLEADKRSGLVSVGHLALVGAAAKWVKLRQRTCQFGTWAFKIVRWRMQDAVRRQKSLPQEEADECELPAVADDVDSFEHVRGLLCRLPDDERRVIELVYGIGHRAPASLEQVARRVRKPVPVVRQLIQSGIMRLRWDAVRGKA